MPRSLNSPRRLNTTVDPDGNRHTKLVNLVEERFDIIFLDEGLQALGASSRQIIRDIHPDTLIIGFTATPDYHATRGLESLLPVLIHRLDLKEAIRYEHALFSHPVAIPAPTTKAQEFAISAVGEYQNKSLKQLIHNSRRNAMVVSIATRLIREGTRQLLPASPVTQCATRTLLPTCSPNSLPMTKTAFRGLSV